MSSLVDIDAAWPEAHDKALVEADYFRENRYPDEERAPLRHLAEAYLALRALVETL